MPETAGQGEHFASQYEALMQAVLEVRAEGGGVVWVHDLDCEWDLAGAECPCVPVRVEVPGDS